MSRGSPARRRAGAGVAALAVWLLAVWLLAAVPGSAETELDGTRSHAVVIGIGDYAEPVWPDLTHPVKDARAVAGFLRGRGFEVVTLYDAAATRTAILTVLEDVLPERVRPGDRVVLYYSGHGHTRSFAGQDYGYLVPHDAGAGTGSMLSMDTLSAWSRKMAAARHQLFLMDACFGGLLAPKAAPMPAVDPDHPDYIQEILRRDARQYLTAGGRDQQVLDGGPSGYSYFTGYLLEALQDGFGDLDGDGYITASELASYLVPRATNPYQTPGAGTLPGHGLGDFVFRRPDADGRAPRPSRGETSGGAKGRPQQAELPPGTAPGVPDRPPEPGSGAGLAALVAARSDETRQALQRLVRRTAYGALSTARLTTVDLVETLQDGPDSALLELGYHAVNKRTRDRFNETIRVRVRLEDGRLVFERAR
jgi:hypothetical protein